MNNTESEKKIMFLMNLENENGNIYKAMKLSEVSLYKIKKWRQDDPEFDYRMNELSELEVRWVEDKLKEKINEGNVSSIQFFLKTKGKDFGYGDTQKIEVTTGTNVEQALESLAAQVSGAENKSLDQTKADPEESK